MAKKKRRKSVISLIMSTLILIFCVYSAFNFEKYIDLESGSGLDIKFKSSSDQAPCFFAHGRALVFDSRTLDCYRSDGTLEWTKELYSKSLFIGEISNEILIAEKSVGDLFVIDVSGNIKHQRTDIGTIDSIDTGGDSICIYSETGNKITVLDKNLDVISEIPNISGNMTSLDYSKKRKEAAVSVIDSNDEQIFSEIRIYDDKGKLVEVVSRYGSIAYRVNFYKNGVIYVSDKEISYIELPGGREVWSKPIDRNVRSFDIWDDRFIAYNTRGGEKDSDDISYVNELDLINEKGESVFNTDSIDLEPIKIRTTDRYVAITDNKRLAIYDASGNLSGLEELPKDYVDIRQVDRNQLAVIFKNRLVIKKIN